MESDVGSSKGRTQAKDSVVSKNAQIDWDRENVQTFDLQQCQNYLKNNDKTIEKDMRAFIECRMGML